jgi:hypothetical protein
LIWKILFSLLGLGSFVFILNEYGFAKVAADLASLGWWVIPLAASFLPVAFLYGLAWFLVTPSLPLSRLPGMLRLSVISLGWNNLSPFMKVLGEPVRVLLMEDWIPRKAALESAILYNLVHILGTLLAFILAGVIILAAYPVSDTIHYAFLGVMAAATVLLLVIYYLPFLTRGRSRQRRRRGGKIGFMPKARYWLRWSFSRMRLFSRRYPARFWSAVGVEIVVRFVEGLTFYVAFRALGAPISALAASLLDVGRALLDNALFFIPYQVGSREAGILLLSEHVLGIGKNAVVSASVFYRLVEIFYMALGYALWTHRASSRKVST